MDRNYQSSIKTMKFVEKAIDSNQKTYRCFVEPVDQWSIN